MSHQENFQEDKEFKSEHFIDLSLFRMHRCVFKSCRFSGCNFRNSSFSECTFTNCSMDSVYDTQLTESDFTYTDLEGTFFHRCNLSKADFRGAINYSINPQSNSLKKAIFSAPEVLSLLSFFDITVES